MESEFIVEGPQEDHDVSYKIVEGNEELLFLEKGILASEFKENTQKRNLKTEFRILRRITENQLFVSQFREYNPDLNLLDRYATIIPFKHSMVCLPQLEGNDEKTHNYINASYISSSKKGDKKAFIVTQGPKKNTIEHFWRMIWHNNVRTIVMLCKDNFQQCEKYWAYKENDAYQSIKIESENLLISYESEEKTNDSVTIRKIKVTKTEPGDLKEERIILQHQFTGWPDHKVPPESEYENLQKLVDKMIEWRKDQPDKPIVIHCSAGIGRSGSLVAIYNIQQLLEENKKQMAQQKISVFGVIRRLREQRWSMVENESQYLFIHEYLINYINKHLEGGEDNANSDSQGFTQAINSENNAIH